MGEPTRLPTMIDDMGGLHTHASEAFRAGKVSGRDEFFRAVLTLLGQISAEQESGPVNGSEEAVATRGFHVAEACCKAVREVKEFLDSRKQSAL